MKVSTGTWTKGTKLSYRWYVGGKPYGRATSKTFVVPKKAAGKKIRVRVHGGQTGYVSEVRMSKNTAKVRR